MKNKFLLTINLMASCFLLLGCKENVSSISLEDSSSGYSFTDDMKFLDKLALINRVDTIEKITQSSSKPIFSNKVMVTFDMPYDWNNFAVGSFPLRVEIGYYKKDAPTVYQCHGYSLNDVYGSSYLSSDDRHELAKLYTTNFVNMEHRFFYKSVDKNKLSNDGVEYWQYMTSENAAKDFHFIIENLSYIMTGKKIMTGASKGGYVTNVQALLYPNDCDVYVPYVAPLCDGVDDERFFKNIYETIGDTKYGSEQAKANRDDILKLQIELLKNREPLAQRFYDNAIRSGMKFRDYVTKDNMFDTLVLDAATGVWQYDHDFSSVRRILNMPKVDDPSTSKNEYEAFLSSALSWLENNSPASAWDIDDGYMPYYYQSITEMGNYRFDFSYIRDELIRQELPSSLLTISKEEEVGLWQRMLFTPEQINSFTYSSEFRNRLINLSNETEANIAMVYGQTDTWYAVRIPENDNPHIKIFALPDQPHGASYSNMSSSMKNEFKTTLDSWLGVE